MPDGICAVVGSTAAIIECARILVVQCSRIALGKARIEIGLAVLTILYDKLAAFVANDVTLRNAASDECLRLILTIAEGQVLFALFDASLNVRWGTSGIPYLRAVLETVGLGRIAIPADRRARRNLDVARHEPPLDLCRRANGERAVRNVDSGRELRRIATAGLKLRSELRRVQLVWVLVVPNDDELQRCVAVTGDGGALAYE